ncbi:MAG: hypothetical protein GWP08_00555 [Nitrospiraceae bacterium]|nr:hypothetical protein [Nitrospiraceae bacterium]
MLPLLGAARRLRGEVLGVVPREIEREDDGGLELGALERRRVDGALTLGATLRDGALELGARIMRVLVGLGAEGLGLCIVVGAE